MGRHKKPPLCNKCGTKNPNNFYRSKPTTCKECIINAALESQKRNYGVDRVNGSNFVIMEQRQQFTGRFVSIEDARKHYREHFEHFPDYRNRKFAVGEWVKGKLNFIDEL